MARFRAPAPRNWRVWCCGRTPGAYTACRWGKLYYGRFQYGHSSRYFHRPLVVVCGEVRAVWLLHHRSEPTGRQDTLRPCRAGTQRENHSRHPIAEFLLPEERARYTYPQVRVIQPGGPYFKMPWEKIHKVAI